MGILIITVLLGIIAIVLDILLTDKKIKSDVFSALSTLTIIADIVVALVLPIGNVIENRGNEAYHISQYEEAERLSRVITDDFITACEIKKKVDRANDRLKIAKKYNQKNEFMFGIFKEKTFAQYDYIEYNWEK